MNSTSNDAAQLTLLGKDLKAAGDRVGQAVPDLLMEIAGSVVSYAQQFAPVKTGKLRNSIRVLAQDEESITVGTDVKYGRYQEFGTKTRGEFSSSATAARAKPIRGKKVPTKVLRGVPPHPFMRPAVVQVGQELNEKLGDIAVVTIVKGPNA